jgi:hypothetical protein
MFKLYLVKPIPNPTPHNVIINNFKPNLLGGISYESCLLLLMSLHLLLVENEFFMISGVKFL